MDRQTLNAGVVTRRVKAHLRQAKCPAYRVSTRYTKLSQAIEGRWFAWQVFIHDLDGESMEVVEHLMDNLSGRLETSRCSGFLSIIVEDR